ncbi:MAG TPA: hypothetical protein VLH19_05510 [Patescibacteria group bacterium]|nr:hypothetical protein [Patescibacteria group bacterium]
MLNEKYRVREKTGVWRIVNPFLQETAHAIYPNIWLPSQHYRDYISGDPKPQTQRAIVHETKHLDRQTEIGLPKWYISYLLSSSFRLEEELLAIKEEMKLSKENDFQIDLEFKAKWLSSWMYLWCVSKEDATKILQQMWEAL